MKIFYQKNNLESQRCQNLYPQQHNSSDNDICYRKRYQYPPTQMHQLVISKSWNRPSNPHIKENKTTYFCKQNSNSNHICNINAPIFYRPTHPGIIVATKKQNRQNGRRNKHICILCKQIKTHFHRRILRMIAPN